MNLGCAAICSSGRPEDDCSPAAGGGMRMNRSSATVTSAKAVSDR